MTHQNGDSATAPPPATGATSTGPLSKRKIIHHRLLMVVALVLFLATGGTGTKKQRAKRIGVAVLIVASILIILFTWEWILRGIAFLILLAIWGAIGIGALYLAGMRTTKSRSRANAQPVFSNAPGAVFERWVADQMRLAGWRHVAVSGGAGDRGVDIRGTAPSGRMYIVQCKRYAKPVGARDVQTFIGLRHFEHGNAPAIFVTSSSYTAQAADHLRNAGIVAMDIRHIRRGLPASLRSL